jgi:hypothetical protein
MGDGRRGNTWPRGAAQALPHRHDERRESLDARGFDVCGRRPGRVLESGYHHKAVISKVGIAGECAAALPVLAPPALELPVSLVETDFEGALRPVDNAVQSVQ